MFKYFCCIGDGINSMACSDSGFSTLEESLVSKEFKNQPGDTNDTLDTETKLTWAVDAPGPLPVLTISPPVEFALRPTGFPPFWENSQPALLPNGVVLPDFSIEEAPRISVPRTHIHPNINMYLGPRALAIFVITPFDPKIDATFPILNESRKEKIGSFGLVKKRANHQGGFIVSFLLPPKLVSAPLKHLDKFSLD